MSPNPDLTTKTVRIGYKHRPFGSVDLNVWQLAMPHVEAGGDLSHGAVFKAEGADDVRRCFYLDQLAVFGLACDGAAGIGDRRSGRDRLYGSDHIHQSRQIVGAHIEHWPAAPLVVELGRR